MSQIVVFAADSAALAYADKKGALHAISAEGAVFKGGAALVALKDAALDSALQKAVNGRYRAAADIIGAAFPAVLKACEKLVGSPSANKSNFITLLNGAGRVQPAEGKDFSAKQKAARQLINAYVKATVVVEDVKGEVIEA